MELLYTIASVLVILLISSEIVAGVIIYRNRHRIGPILRHLLGLDTDSIRNISSHMSLERKINYIGRHTKFERQELRRLGILKEIPHANLRGAEQVVLPLRNDR